MYSNVLSIQTKILDLQTSSWPESKKFKIICVVRRQYFRSYKNNVRYLLSENFRTDYRKYKHELSCTFVYLAYKTRTLLCHFNFTCIIHFIFIMYFYLSNCQRKFCPFRWYLLDFDAV
jgi:hypothetical protein